MKKYIAASDNDSRLSELLPKCTNREKQIIRNIEHRGYNYLRAVVEVTTLLGCNATDAFVDVINTLLEDESFR